LEQFNRVKRYHIRIQNIYSGAYQTEWSDRISREDDVVTFFIHCFHLRDWIIHLNRVGVTAKEVDNFINKHLELKICADFANGSKHCTLTRTTRTKLRQPHIVTFEHKSLLGLSEDSFKSKFQILSGRNVYDVLTLATQCVDLWEKFIKEIEKKPIKT